MTAAPGCPLVDEWRATRHHAIGSHLKDHRVLADADVETAHMMRPYRRVGDKLAQRKRDRLPAFGSDGHDPTGPADTIARQASAQHEARQFVAQEPHGEPDLTRPRGRRLVNIAIAETRDRAGCVEGQRGEWLAVVEGVRAAHRSRRKGSDGLAIDGERRTQSRSSAAAVPIV